MAEVHGTLPRVELICRSETRYRCLALRGGLMTVDRSGCERCGNGGGNGTRPLAACDGEGGDTGSRGGRAGGGASVSSLCSDSTLSDDASSTIFDLTTVAIARLHNNTSLERLSTLRRAALLFKTTSATVTRRVIPISVVYVGGSVTVSRTSYYQRR